MHILDVYTEKIGNKLIEISEAIKAMKELVRKVEWKSKFTIGKTKDLVLPEIDERVVVGDAIVSVKLLSWPREYCLQIEIEPSERLEQEVRNSIPRTLGDVGGVVFKELCRLEAMKEGLKENRLEKALEGIFGEYEELLKYLKEKIDEIKETFAKEIIAKEI